jgi:hypothetical protein
LKELDAARQDPTRATHAQKLRLRKIARAEEALATRSAELAKAIGEEGSLVFRSVFTRVDEDLKRIAALLTEEGDWQSGERVQALQQDVEQDLDWLGTALAEEKDRRRDEEQNQEQQQQQQQQQQPENRLVPDEAELKLLRRMEVDVMESIERLLVLHPELDSEADLDPLLLEDVSRLARRHEKTSELFIAFRKRLGVPDPGAEATEPQPFVPEINPR